MPEQEPHHRYSESLRRVLGEGLEAAPDLVSELKKYISPAEIVKTVREGFRAYSGYRMLAFGAQSVGKTTLWKYLETGRGGAQVEKTLAVSGVGGANADPRLRLRTIRALGLIKVAIRAFDVPGDPEYRHTWGEVLQSARPELVVFLVDHDADSSEVPGDGFTPSRMQDHAQAFGDLATVLSADPALAGNIKQIMVLANKYDVWHTKMPYGTLLQKADVYNQMNKLQPLLPTAGVRYGYCSALTGENVTELMRTVFKELA